MNTPAPARLSLQNRFIHYVNRRRGPLTLPLELHYRQIFILPSKFGSGFAFMLALMTLAALNYNNNPALILSYLLQAIFLYSSNLVYKNLRGIRISAVACEPVFAGQTAEFVLQLIAADKRPALEIICDNFQTYTALVENQATQIAIPQKAERRGSLKLKPWKIQSSWPFGFFRAWSWVVPEETCLVYPRPAENPPPLPTTGQLEGRASSQLDDDQLHALREYRDGDPLNRIAWRSSARSDTLISRENEQQKRGDIHLDWAALNGIDTETRLSILCAWVLQAETQSLSWSLSLPGQALEKGCGHQHQQLALSYLALFETTTSKEDSRQ